MAQADIAEKNLIALNDVFADIFNVLVFEGKQIMSENMLMDQSPVSQYKADDDKLHEQERDTFKLWNGHGVNLLLAGIENQTEPDKDMPFRIIGYDGAAYRSQLLKAEEKMMDGKMKRVPSKERYPVLTIVLYFGKKLWNYPRSLKECFEPSIEKSEIMDVLNRYIQDYQVHVFDIPRLSKEQVQLFRSDFKIVADFFTKVYNNSDYVPDDAVIKHVDEFLKLMKVLTGDRRFEETAHTMTKSEKEEFRMCSIFDEREERGFKRGIEQGIEQGKVSTLVFLVKDGIISKEIAVEKSGMTKEEFEKLL